MKHYNCKRGSISSTASNRLAFNRACDTDPHICPGAAESTTVGPARLPHWPSQAPPSARRLAAAHMTSGRLCTATARLSADRPHACMRCDARTFAHQRAPAREQGPNTASCCMGRRGAAAAASGGLGAAAEAEEEVDLVLTLVPTRCLRARAGEA
jgi:hypothetical protein